MEKTLKLSMVCSSFLVLMACGGVGTEITNKNLKGGVKDKGCTQSVRTSLGTIEDLCLGSNDLNEEANRQACLVEAEGLTLENPNFVCSFGEGNLVDSDFIKENIIDKYGNRKAEIEDSGIFDE